MENDEFYALSPEKRKAMIEECQKKRDGGGQMTKRRIQEITTDAVATTISAMITVDPLSEDEGPSANAGDSFGGKQNQIKAKISKLKSGALVAQTKRAIMESLVEKVD